MSANERQVGGEHYKGAGMEHWDFVTMAGLGYLRGCASKYVYRWRDKGGLSDLKKAGHYIEKLSDLSESDAREKFKHGAAVAAEYTGQFIRLNNIPKDEATILSFLASDYDLGLANSHLRAFIARLENEGYQEEPSDLGKLKHAQAELEAAKEAIVALKEAADENAAFIARLNADAAVMSDKMNEMAAALTAAQAEIATMKAASPEEVTKADPALTSKPAPKRK